MLYLETNRLRCFLIFFPIDLGLLVTYLIGSSSILESVFQDQKVGNKTVPSHDFPLSNLALAEPGGRGGLQQDCCCERAFAQSVGREHTVWEGQHEPPRQFSKVYCTTVEVCGKLNRVSLFFPPWWSSLLCEAHKSPIQLLLPPQWFLQLSFEYLLCWKRFQIVKAILDHQR